MLIKKTVLQYMYIDIVVKSLKNINKVTIETCFPYIPIIKESEGDGGWVLIPGWEGEGVFAILPRGWVLFKRSCLLRHVCGHLFKEICMVNQKVSVR